LDTPSSIAAWRRQARSGYQLRISDPAPGAPQTATLRLRPREPKTDPLGNPSPLELRNRFEDVQLNSASRRGGVDALPQAYKGHTEL